MLFFNRVLTAQHYVFAGLLAAIVPMALGYVIVSTNPSACYDGPCAIPLLLMIVSPFAALLLSILFALNRRREKPFPDGWLPTVLMSVVGGQMAISVFGVISAPQNIRRHFFSDVLFIPQGTIVGLAVGVVFWFALYAFGYRRTTE